MKISDRLKCIAALVENSETVVDIGTDHAYLPVYLIKKEICKKVIASDVRNDPVKKARRNINKSGFADKIEVRLGDGLRVIEHKEAETIIIAGMGGKQITRILESGQDIVRASRSMILQPMTQHFELRSWLKQNGYEILDEDLCKEEGRIYLILKVSCEPKKQADINTFFGSILFIKKHQLLADYIKKYIRELEEVRKDLLSTNSEKLNEKLEEIEQRLGLFNKFLDSV